MKELETIFQEIRTRKIEFDENNLSKWLFEYAIECQEYTRKNIDQIILKKAKDILDAVDSIYRRFDKRIVLTSIPLERVSFVARNDYGSVQNQNRYQNLKTS